MKTHKILALSILPMMCWSGVALAQSTNQPSCYVHDASAPNDVKDWHLQRIVQPCHPLADTAPLNTPTAEPTFVSEVQETQAEQGSTSDMANVAANAFDGAKPNIYNFVPSVQVGLSINSRDGDDEPFFLSGGLRFYPDPQHWSLFAEGNIELLFDREVSLIPTLKFGAAYLLDEPESFIAQMLPAFMVYGIFGMHIPDEDNPQTIRMGLGINSPLGLIVSLIAMGESGVPIPNGLELAMDYDGVTAESVVHLKLVFGF